MRHLNFLGFLVIGLAAPHASTAATPPPAVVNAAPAPGGAAAAAAADSSIAGVGPDDPVITLDGFCADAPRQRPCSTVITRAQFERLVDALQPDMPLPLRLQVANALARTMRMSVAAEERGLDKTPAFAEELRYARLQLLSQDLDSALRAEAKHVSDADLEQYYQRNQSSFEQATVARIFVPHATVSGAGAQTMTQLAAELRARARSGEDPDSLQRAAYHQAGITKSNAVTVMDKVRRSSLPPAHEAVFDLMPGQVSEVFSDPDGAHFIYKMIAKQTLSFEAAKEEIRAGITAQRYRDSIKPFQGGAIFSDAYFNPPRAPGPPPLRNHRWRKPAPETAGHD